MAVSIGLEGILAVEMFLTTAGELLVNELAPRPHNSYHTTEVACVTSQFEQLVRAACDLPLGSTAVTRPSAIVNLFGDLWSAGQQDKSSDPMSDLRVTAGLFTLYTFALIAIEKIFALIIHDSRHRC